MKVEDQVQLAHVPEVAVEDLDELMDDVEYNQLIVFLLNSHCKVETCISKFKLLLLPPKPYLLNTIL